MNPQDPIIPQIDTHQSLTDDQIKNLRIEARKVANGIEEHLNFNIDSQIVETQQGTSALLTIPLGPQPIGIGIQPPTIQEVNHPGCLEIDERKELIQNVTAQIVLQMKNMNNYDEQDVFAK